MNGYQSALMVPTEVLARQHYESLCTLLKENNLTEYNPRLLTGSTKAKERREIYASLEDGSCKMSYMHKHLKENNSGTVLVVYDVF